MHCNYVHIVLMSNCEIHHPGHRTEVKANIGGGDKYNNTHVY